MTGEEGVDWGGVGEAQRVNGVPTAREEANGPDFTDERQGMGARELLPPHVRWSVLKMKSSSHLTHI